jgi:protein gp37
MGDRTLISWAIATWNPVRGCSRVSAGCQHCYAERQAIRQAGPGQAYEGLVRSSASGPRWTGELAVNWDGIDQPLRWRRPRRIFVNSMSDLFHEKLSDKAIDRVFAVMLAADWHDFLVLTKRPERARAYLTTADRSERIQAVVDAELRANRRLGGGPDRRATMIAGRRLPLPNVWIGASVEDQRSADERVPILLDTPAAVRWLSVEPLLGPVELQDEDTSYLRGIALDLVADPIGTPGLDWIVVGGESGPGARPCRVSWIRDLVRQCDAADVPVFVKQLGAVPFEDQDASEWPAAWPEHVECRLAEPAPAHEAYGLRSRKGEDPSEWPSDLRRRELPAASRVSTKEPSP